MELKKTELSLIVSGAISAMIFIVGLILFGFEPVYLIFLIVISIFIVIMPYLVIQYLRTKRLLKMEKHFPSLLRDLSEARRAGMTVPNAISQASKTDYGPLTKRVKEMHRKLTWGIPLPEVLGNFREKVKGSSLMRRGLGIVLESYYSGGDISSTMDAIADSTTTLQDVRNERKSMLRQQLMIIYVIHFVFIGTIIAMFKIMIPLLTVPGQEGGGGEGEFAGVSGMMGGAPSMDYFRMLFLITLIVQSIGNGVVAGEARSGSVVDGVKHASIMLAGALVSYAFFILPKNKNLQITVEPDEPSPGGVVNVKASYRVDRKAAQGAVIKIDLAGQQKTGTADENGEISKKFVAPDTPGTYQLKITATYKKSEIEKTRDILVK